MEGSGQVVPLSQCKCKNALRGTRQCWAEQTTAAILSSPNSWLQACAGGRSWLAACELPLPQQPCHSTHLMGPHRAASPSAVPIGAGPPPPAAKQPPQEPCLPAAALPGAAAAAAGQAAAATAAAGAAGGGSPGKEGQAGSD